MFDNIKSPLVEVIGKLRRYESFMDGSVVVIPDGLIDMCQAVGIPTKATTVTIDSELTLDIAGGTYYHGSVWVKPGRGWEVLAHEMVHALDNVSDRMGRVEFVLPYELRPGEIMAKAIQSHLGGHISHNTMRGYVRRARLLRLGLKLMSPLIIWGLNKKEDRLIRASN